MILCFYSQSCYYNIVAAISGLVKRVLQLQLSTICISESARNLVPEADTISESLIIEMSLLMIMMTIMISTLLTLLIG